jgi:sec-independent protein translocase protein TatB
VLGPEKLPRVVSELGRWVGRARSMARQFREQLEEEVQLEEARKAQAATPPPAEPVPTAAPGAPTTAESSAAHSPHAGNGGPGGSVSPETAPNPYSNDHHDRASGADPSANQATQAAGADERRT